MLTGKYRPSLSHFIDSYLASLRMYLKISQAGENHNLFFSPSKAKPYSEMISDAEGAKRFEVSLLLIILLTLFTGTSSVSSFHSRSADAPLHVIRQSRSILLPQVCPPLRSRGLALCFLQHKEIVTVAKKNYPEDFLPRVFLL